MATFRKIVVNDKEYQWKFTLDEFYYEGDSHLVIRSGDKKGKMIIHFRTGKFDHGFCPFNKGLPATYKGEPVAINLNQPRFIAEIITYRLSQQQTDSLTGHFETRYGLEMLHDMGYEFEYEKNWEVEAVLGT